MVCLEHNWLRPSDAYMRLWTNHHWFRYWLVAWPMPSHYPNQCRNIVNRALRNEFQWNLSQNVYSSVHLKMFSRKWQPFCVVLNVLADRLYSIDYWVMIKVQTLHAALLCNPSPCGVTLCFQFVSASAVVVHVLTFPSHFKNPLCLNKV